MALVGGQLEQEMEIPPPPPPRSTEPPPPPPPRSIKAEGGVEIDLERAKAPITAAAITARLDDPLSLSAKPSRIEVMTNDNTAAAKPLPEHFPTLPALPQAPGWKSADQNGDRLEGSVGLPIAKAAVAANLGSVRSLSAVRNEAWVGLTLLACQCLPVASILHQLPLSAMFRTVPLDGANILFNVHPSTSALLCPHFSSCCLLIIQPFNS